MNTPLVSVVTVVRNGAATIERTLASVLAQDYPRIEYLVVDGASTDGTLDIVRRHGDRIANISSEPDEGPYDAMNRGAARATGEWIVFMNGGDVFAAPDAVSRVFADVGANACDVLYGDGIVHGDTFRVVERAEEPISLSDGNGFSHQSAFVRAALQQRYRFVLDEPIAADYDLFLRLFKDGKVFRHVDVVVSEFFSGGLSTLGRPETIRLRHRVYRKHFARSDLVLYRRLAAFHAKEALRACVPRGVWRRLKRRLSRNAELSLERH